MKRNRIIALFLMFVMLLGTAVPAYAKSNDDTKDKKDKQAKPKVYFIDQNGNAQKSYIDADYFEALSKNGEATLTPSSDNDANVPSIAIPPTDGDAIRI